MDFKKLKDKKTVSAFVTILVALLASFGVDLGNETITIIRDVAVGLIGGAGAGATAMKRTIEKKIKDNVLSLDAGVKAVDGHVNAITAKAKAEFGDSVGAFVEAELNPMKDELKAMTGIEWKF